jgi:hypothetical protein
MKTWNINRAQFKVSDFITWQRNGELDLRPYFQRRPVWNAGAKSYLIDTVMRGLPIPALIIRDCPPDLKTFSTGRQIVDGQQRIRTLISFIAPDLLPDFKEADDAFTIRKSHNEKYARRSFRDLPSHIQSRILDYQFMVHIFPSETDDRDILEIFARMNSTGYQLNDQELRNATYFGEFKTLSYSLASKELARWMEWSLFSEADIGRMKEVTLTSELFILIMQGISDASKRVITRAYIENDDEFPGAGEVSRRFSFVMDVIDNLPVQSRQTFQKKALFYPFFAALYDIIYGLESDLHRKKAIQPPKDTLNAIVRAGERIAKGMAPEKILSVAQRRTSQAIVRRTIKEYLLKGV